MKPEEPLKLSPFQPLHRHRILGVDHRHPILMSNQGLSECGLKPALVLVSKSLPSSLCCHSEGRQGIVSFSFCVLFFID